MRNPFAAQEAAFLEFVEANRDLGYGNMMHLISEHWRKQDPLGALSVGPCFGVLTKGAETLGAGVVVVPVEFVREYIESHRQPPTPNAIANLERIERAAAATERLDDALRAVLSRLQQNGGEAE